MTRKKRSSDVIETHTVMLRNDALQPMWHKA